MCLAESTGDSCPGQRHQVKAGDALALSPWQGPVHDVVGQGWARALQPRGPGDPHKVVHRPLGWPVLFQPGLTLGKKNGWLPRWQFPLRGSGKSLLARLVMNSAKAGKCGLSRSARYLGQAAAAGLAGVEVWVVPWHCSGPRPLRAEDRAGVQSWGAGSPSAQLLMKPQPCPNPFPPVAEGCVSSKGVRRLRSWSQFQHECERQIRGLSFSAQNAGRDVCVLQWVAQAKSWRKKPPGR